MADESALAAALQSAGIPAELSADLATYFSRLRHEVQTEQLEKASAGKFVETVVQVLQARDPARKNYDKHVNVDKELRDIYESREIPGMPADTRVGIIRAARTIYALRSKRGMIHKSGPDPNLADLLFVFQNAQWIMAEFVRLSTSLPVDEANRILDRVTRPVIPIVEEVLGTSVVLLEGMTISEEVLVLLLHHYNDDLPLSKKGIVNALARRSTRGVDYALDDLWKGRLIGRHDSSFALTATGLHEARRIVQERQTVLANARDL